MSRMPTKRLYEIQIKVVSNESALERSRERLKAGEDIKDLPIYFKVDSFVGKQLRRQAGMQLVIYERIRSHIRAEESARTLLANL